MKTRHLILFFLCMAMTVSLSAQRPIYKDFSSRRNLQVADLYNVDMGGYRKTVTLIKPRDFYSFVALCHEFSIKVSTDSVRCQRRMSITILIRDKNDPRCRLPRKPDGRNAWRKRCVVGCSYEEQTIYIINGIRSDEEFKVVVQYILEKLKDSDGKEVRKVNNEQ